MHCVAQAALGLLVALQYAQAWPADAEAGAALPAGPDVTPVPVATKTFVTVESSTTRYPPSPEFFKNLIEENRYTTIRTIEEPATLTNLPTTVVQRVVMTIQTEHYQTVYQIDRWGRVRTDMPISSSSGFNSQTASGSSTWLVYRPAATHLPAGTGTDALPCAQCAPPDAPPRADARCAAIGLATACQGQCVLREDGLLWCYRMYNSLETSYDNRVMGRVCWGNTTAFAQLNEPCVQGDYAIGCTPCLGKPPMGYAPYKWIDV